ncbi:MAG: DNA primase, partial [Rhodothermales bacterium]|nr:DNA primase [Rhodothermales bacterium]
IALPDAEQDLAEASETESILHALRFAARTYHDQLIAADEADAARRYLRERGLSASSIRKFGLGYALNGWEPLQAAARSSHIPVEVLSKAGLVIKRKDRDGFYDRFRGRIMFPILSHVGKVLGFGARVMDGGADEPKYINSPETKVYHKSRVLYGLYQARREIRRAEEVFLVEGYTDVISLHQEGVENTVASSGTALTADQIGLLDRYCKRLVLLFDADSAGANAAVRGIDLVLQRGMAVYVVTLPEGDDPDSFARREGGDAFREYALEHRKDFVTFKYEYGLSVLKEDTPEALAALQRSVIRSVAAIPDPLVQESYLKRASDVLSVPETRLFEALQRVRSKSRGRRARRSPPPSPPAQPTAEQTAPMRPQPRVLPEEKTLLRLMLERGEPLVEFILGRMALNEFTEGPSREIASALMQMYEAEHIDRDQILDGTFGPEVQQLAAAVLVDSVEVSENWEKRQNITVPQLNEDAFESASSAMVLLKLDRIDEVIEEKRREIYNVSQEGGDVQAYQQTLMQLLQLRRSIEKREFLENEGHEA